MPEAALLATLLTESAAMGSQRSSDLSFLFNDFCRIVKGEGYQRVAQSTAKRILKLSSQLLSRLEGKSALRQMTAKGERAVWGCLLSAFPDHLAKQRGETSNRYLLANGHEVQLHQQDSLQGLPWLLVIDASTSQQSKQLPFVRQAVALAESQAMAFMSSRIREQVSLIWDGGAGAFRATQQKRYGKIVLSERQIKPNVQELKQAVLDYVQEQGLAIMNDQAYRQLAARVDWLSRHTSSELPDFSESTLLRQVHDWLALYINNVKTKADLARIDVASILWAQLDWSQQRLLDEKVPVSLKLPTGSNRQIDYHRLDKPVVSARMQEFYGLQQTPTIGDGFPLLVELLSPAQRPMQLTNDLPGFWAGSYREVAKEMRGRYPRHFWPEDPAKAKATATTKKKMS
jgi:ATP-dependent helicase HrpB